MSSTADIPVTPAPSDRPVTPEKVDEGSDRADDSLKAVHNNGPSTKKEADSTLDDDVSPAETLNEEIAARKMSSWAWLALCLSVMSSTFLFSLDNTIVANIQPAIIKDLGDIDKLPWVSVGFALGSASISLGWGRLYNLIDSKKLYCIAVLLFEVGSALCGAAPSMNALIVGRAIAGFGGSGIYIGTMNIFTGLTSKKERSFYISIIGVMYAGGTILGPIIGGAFASSKATWRWSFYINLCIAGLAAPVYLFVLPSLVPRPNETKKQLLRQFDIVGLVLFAGASACLVMGIAFGGAVFAWNSGQTIALFTLAGILWIAFGVQQAYSIFTTPQYRLFPVRFLRSAQLCLLFAQIAASGSVVYVSLYFLPLYFQFIRGDSAIMSGVRLLPNVFAAVVGAVANGLGMPRYGVYMPWFLAGGVLMTAGSALLYTITVDISWAKIYGYGVLLAFGTGLCVQAPFAVAQAKVDSQDTIDVTAFLSTGQIGGITLALSIASTIFINQATHKIMALFPGVPASEIQSAVTGGDANLFASLPKVYQERTLATIVDAIDETFILMITSGALIIVMSLFMKRERLNIDRMVPFGA